MPYDFIKLAIQDVYLIKPKIFEDNRGFFFEIFKNDDFNKNGIKESFVQANISRSKKNVLRGLHFQASPKAQGKLITVLKGEIFDVVVDIRTTSPTYGKWDGKILTDSNRQMIYVPPGFAHGFCARSEVAEVIYYCTKPYSPEHERSIKWNDEDIGIDWGISDPILSEKDKNAPLLKEIIKACKI